MSKFPEMPSSSFQVIGDKLYHVRKFGIGGQVLEEELVPVPVMKAEDTLRNLFNRQRDQLFVETDWIRQRHEDRTALGVDDAVNWNAWLNYWQALRDLPAAEGFDPERPIWPQKPE